MKDRGTGRSTRQIDDAVQDLFMTGECVIIDHHGDRESSRFTFDKLLKRLQFEHAGIMNTLEVDMIKCSVKIKDFK